jgi:hypothetical protein
MFGKELLPLLVPWLTMAAGGAPHGKAPEAPYSHKVHFQQGVALHFKDFDLTYQGIHYFDNPVYEFTYQDFLVISGKESHFVSWSSGLGELVPQPFHAANRDFYLELGYSETLGALTYDELVITAEADTTDRFGDPLPSSTSAPDLFPCFVIRSYWKLQADASGGSVAGKLYFMYGVDPTRPQVQPFGAEGWRGTFDLAVDRKKGEISFVDEAANRWTLRCQGKALTGSIERAPGAPGGGPRPTIRISFVEAPWAS